MEARPILLKFPFKHIKKVGIELEGGWIEKPAFTVHHDGSVHCEGNYKGESHTDPKSTIPEIFTELGVKYPDIVDTSCGMHVHISASDLDYSILATRKFHNYFLERMELTKDFLKTSNKEDYDNFISRLSGNNSFCKKEFDAEKQVRRTEKGGNRYTMLNYCYGLHTTMECRMFPMFTKYSTAKLCIVEFLHTIETFLDKHKEKLTHEVLVEIQDEPVEREIICA